ncbi:MAG TPA: selenocysteine-specific translation elongation factor [Acidimicrobiales bacterium]|nr:selenocysteine-specific translation elongation factor [Acidimicrobiales bacterium]
MHVIATAGHVDHGKSTLVLALTGTDPDRFAAEKERGLTIDLGFAWTELPSGRELAFVDVPGHVRFLKNMLAGVGAVEACLFVVAATEGWKPQSEEHLRILELLGVRHGVVAVTHAAKARFDPADCLAGSFLADAEVVPVDSPTGVGIEELRHALDRLLDRAPQAVDRGRPRLWVDRSFAAKGSGTVVTGTLAGGSLAVGEEVVVLPSGRKARVRALQTHKASVERVGPGRRVAVNLAGIAYREITRGHAVVRPGQWEPSRTVDCSLAVLPSVGHEVTRRGAYQAYIGSGEHAVRIRLLGEGAVRIHLPTALPLLPGDRYVLRESGRSETVGGGEVLDVAPVLPAAKARPTRSVDRVIEERGRVDVDLLERLTGERREPTMGRWVLSPAALAQAVESRGTEPPADPGPARPYLAALEAAPFAPPPPEGVDRRALRALLREGLVVERDGVWFAASAVEEAARVVARLLADSPEGVTASAVREALGTTRKYVLPLLAHLDATGVTRRRGDVRVGGPRLPDPAIPPGS